MDIVIKRGDPVALKDLPEYSIALDGGEEKGWGGSSTIGGAPRNPDGSRSRLSVKRIVEIIDSVLVPVEDKKPVRNSKIPPKKKPITKKSN